MMRRPVVRLLFIVGWCVTACCSLVFAEPEDASADEQLLKAAKFDTEPPALLEFFRQRTLTDADRDKISALIKKLGDDSFDVREQSAKDLVALGSKTVSLLRQAGKNPDIEIVRRTEWCLSKISNAASESLTAAAARLLAKRKPRGAAGVLLAYLPFADDDNVLEEVRAALAALARSEGRLDPVLLKALEDPAHVKRGAAAEALIRGGGGEARPLVHNLLRDREPRVRLWVAMALVEEQDRSAVPPLIELLAELPQAQGWQAEELLCRLAGEQAPKVALGSDAGARRQCRDAWKTWWRDHGSQVDLAKLKSAERLLGYTLVVYQDNRGLGVVGELGPDKKLRWQVQGLQFAIDAEVLPGNRVLIAEYTGGLVSERNFKGEILWQKPVNMPIGAQRLANGNTFIVCRNQLLEVDRTGKEVFTHARPAHDIMSARKLREGSLVFVTSQGVVTRLNAAGKPEKAAFKALPMQLFGGIDVLANGRVLVPHYTSSKVVEYDGDGKSVWEASVPNPSSVMRLPNGNTLVTSRSRNRLVEVDRSGKEVWQHQVEGQLWRARRR